MTRNEFLELVRTEHARWEEVLAEIAETRMFEPGVAGEAQWSVKDIIAHITWYEREMTGVIEARALVGSELWSVPLDERNEAIYRENKDRPLAEVLDEARQVHDRLMHQLESLSEQDLQDPGRFAEMPSDWKPWAVISSNTYEHYQHHVLQVSTWLAKQTHAL